MFLKGVGLLFVGLAMLGAILPILPTTPFLLVAAACFAKSSPKLHQKLLENKVFGPLIINWQNHKTMCRKTKIIALSTICISVAWSCYVINTLWIKIVIGLLIIWPVVFIATLPELKQKSVD